MEHFTNKAVREITANDILNIIIDEPKYRPFKNAEECWQEMKKHEPFGWLKIKSVGYKAFIHRVNFISINIEDYCYTYEYAFDNFTFIEGTPFGIKEDWHE